MGAAHGEQTGARAADRGPGRADLFERHRPRLRGIAYRMLGSLGDAEDIVQEAYLRWHIWSSSRSRSG
jgi:RNA polymerase sigma-70 factor (ECF subfamily)